VAEAKVFGGNQQVFQCAANADVKFSLVVIRHLEPAVVVQKQVDAFFLDSKFPRLCVVARRSKNGETEKETELVTFRAGIGKVGGVGGPRCSLVRHRRTLCRCNSSESVC